jgi:K+-sensing histidine kinase KdpD
MNKKPTSTAAPSTTEQAPSQAVESKPDVGLLFLSNFVHQVVNPMNGVIGTLSNITDGTYSESVVKQKVNASRAQLEQCISLIRNLAYISDYFFETSEKSALRPPTKDVGTSVLPQVIIESVQFFQVLAEKKRIGMELLDSRTQYRVSARPELLKQVFINLFDNWLKYGDTNQIITVEPTVNSSGDLVVLMCGNSIGFDGADSENIFKLGFRSSQAKRVVAQGSGIGLHVCQQIMENAIGGNIKAEHNGKSHVTTFRLTIPRERWQL